MKDVLLLIRCFHLACRNLLPHVLPVGLIVRFVGVVKKPLCKVFSPHGVHTFGELEELHLLDFSLQVLHEPEKPSDLKNESVVNIKGQNCKWALKSFSIVFPNFPKCIFACFRHHFLIEKNGMIIVLL